MGTEAKPSPLPDEGGELRSDLLAYARKRLKAPSAPEYRHEIFIKRCPQCSSGAVKLKIEEHTTATRTNFRGVVHGTCAHCSHLWQVFKQVRIKKVDGEWVDNGKVRKVQKPTCRCGGDSFYTAVYSLLDGQFYDEGALVGKCSSCGKNQLFFELD